MMNFKRRGFLQAASAALFSPKIAVQKALESAAAATAAVAPAIIDSDYMGQVIGKILAPRQMGSEDVYVHGDGSITLEEYNWKTDELEKLTRLKMGLINLTDGIDHF